MAVRTSKVQRRSLSFPTIPDALAEIDRIVAAEKSGTLRRLGNWSTGQSFHHVATWINFAFDGYPPSLRPPWIIKFLVGFQKNKFIRGPLPAGVKIPRVANGTLGTEETATDAGADELRRAFQRLQAGCPTHDNILFGKLTHDEWIQMNLRHAELHLSFLSY
ncbi:MAG TPA: DUF1569 domain-containing protein [Phycisphaerales bacterium]